MKQKSKGTVTPKLRFPEFTEEWWPTTIGELFNLDNKPVKATHFECDKILTVRLHANGVVRNERTSALTGGSNYFVRRAGQFIFSKIDLLNGAFGIVPVELDGFSSSSDVPAFSFSAEHSPTFFLNWLAARYRRLNIERTGTSATLKRVSPEKLWKLPIMLPTPAEQQKIAECLSSLDGVIAAEGRKLVALRDHKRGLMQQLFPQPGQTQPRLRFPEFRDKGEWGEEPLSVIAENLDNKRVPIAESHRIKGDVPYYGASGIVDYVRDYLFDEDLLCVSEDGANLVARTYPIAFPISGKTWVNNHAHVLRFDKLATQKMVEDYLNFTDLRDFITGMAQPKLNRTMLDTIPIALPEQEEQQRIAACLTALDTQITAQAAKIETLKQHKRGLMQQLFPAPEGI